MVRTVHDEMKDTLGIPRPRKIAPVREAKKRIEKNEKTIKHQVSEQVAREQMKLMMPSIRGKAKQTRVDLNVDEKYKKAIKLQSIFNPVETQVLEKEILAVT